MRPGWMKTLGNSVTSWLSELPKELPLLKRTAENIKDPLFRFFEREIRIGRSILVKVREDLSDLEEICQGAKRTTNYHRDIGMQLVKGIIPPQWKKFTIPLSMTVVSWVANLSRRLEQLQVRRLVNPLWSQDKSKIAIFFRKLSTFPSKERVH